MSSDGWNDDFWRASAERSQYESNVTWPAAFRSLVFWAAVCFIVYLAVTH